MLPKAVKLVSLVDLLESEQTAEQLLEVQPDLLKSFAQLEKTVLVLLLKQRLKINHLLSDQQLRNQRRSLHQPKFQ